MGLTIRDLKNICEEYELSLDTEIFLIDEDGDAMRARSIKIENEMDSHFRLGKPHLVLKL